MTLTGERVGDERKAVYTRPGFVCAEQIPGKSERLQFHMQDTVLRPSAAQDEPMQRWTTTPTNLSCRRYKSARCGPKKKDREP